jgi:hypothetical protein
MIQSCRIIRQMSGYSLARTLTVLIPLGISSLSLQQARSTFYVVQATLAQFGLHAGNVELKKQNAGRISPRVFTCMI